MSLLLSNNRSELKQPIHHRDNFPDGMCPWTHMLISSKITYFELPFPPLHLPKIKHDLINGQHNLKLGLSPTQFQKIWSWYLTHLIKLSDLIERKVS